MRKLLPFLFFLLMIVAFYFNILGLMSLMPLYLTLPLLFLSIYLTLYSFMNRNVYRKRMK
jgi:hypothetical protein